MNRSPLRRAFLLIPLVLACFALLPSVRAVTPAPDGGYPGFNTAEGLGVLGQATPGVWNTAIGAFALNADTTGSIGNVAVGLNALRHNTFGTFNVALGTNALLFNVTGFNNTAVGGQALKLNTASSNTAEVLMRLLTTPPARRTRLLAKGHLRPTTAPAMRPLGLRRWRAT